MSTEGRVAYRFGRLIGWGALTGALLFLIMGGLEALVLFVKRPEPWTLDLFGRLVWTPVLYGLIGLAAGCLLGCLVAVALTMARSRATRSGERAAVWAVALPFFLAFFWLFAAQRVIAGGWRAPAAIIVSFVLVVAAVALALFLWRRAVRDAFTPRAIVRWTTVLVLVLWVPVYAVVAEPSLEYTRTTPRPPVEAEPPSDLNVLFIMVDTLRADCLSCYGPTEFATPNIDGLAAESALFEEVVTPEPKTRPALASMFTGLYPRTHGVDTNAKTLGEEFTSLPEVMRVHGYATAGFTAASVLSGYFGTAQGFDYYAESPHPWFQLRTDCALFRFHKMFTIWPELMNGTRAGLINKRVATWLRDNRRRPFFAYVHYFDPHAPYWPIRKYDFAAAEGLGGARAPTRDRRELAAPDFEMPRDFLRREWLRYRGEIASVDERIGELMRVLEEIGEADRTIVVLVADHGESFEHGVYFSHGVRLYDPEIHVPLMIRDPRDLRPRRLSGQVRLIDLYPTVLELVGLKSPVPCQGVDLTPRLAGGPEASEHLPAFCQTDLEETQPRLARASFGLRLPPWKYIESPRIDLIELYNLERDPAETVDVAEASPEVRGRMAAALGSWMATTERLELPPDELAPQALEALRALGYLQ